AVVNNLLALRMLYDLSLERGLCVFLFFFTDTPTTEIYTLSLHDALPISSRSWRPRRSRRAAWPRRWRRRVCRGRRSGRASSPGGDRKSTRLNSSHDQISYAVFCLKKKKGRPACRSYRAAAHTTASTRHAP